MNCEKISVAKTECPEIYRETEKMYHSLYALSGDVLKNGGSVAVFLSYAGQNSLDDLWEIKILPRKNFQSENLEYDFGVLYRIVNHC